MLASGRSALAGVLLVDDLGLDDLIVSRRFRTAVGRAWRRAGLGRLGLLVDRGAHLLADLRGLLAGRLDCVGVVALQRLLHLGERLAHLGLDVVGHLVLVLAKELLGAVDQAVGLVADLGLLSALAVLLGVLLRVPDHLLAVVLAHRGPAHAPHRLLLPHAPVLRG